MKFINHSARNVKEELSLYAHPKELQEELTKIWEQFHRTLTTIFPYETFQAPKEVRNKGRDGWRNISTVEFGFNPLELPHKGAWELNHPDTIITSEYAALTLEVMKRVAHCMIRVNMRILIPLTEDDKITLRQCGAMQDVTETVSRTITRTIVSCKI